jgi:peptidoglycan/LPS O-acetylase OafA/YrhL
LSAFFAATWFGVLVFRGATEEQSVLYQILNRPLLRNYGKYSYCIYVVHLVFLEHAMWLSGFLRNQLPRASGRFAQLLVIVAANVIIYWVARASWRYYEGPILRLKDKLAPVKPVTGSHKFSLSRCFINLSLNRRTDPERLTAPSGYREGGEAV